MQASVYKIGSYHDCDFRLTISADLAQPYRRLTRMLRYSADTSLPTHPVRQPWNYPFVYNWFFPSILCQLSSSPITCYVTCRVRIFAPIYQARCDAPSTLIDFPGHGISSIVWCRIMRPVRRRFTTGLLWAFVCCCRFGCEYSKVFEHVILYYFAYSFKWIY